MVPGFQESIVPGFQGSVVPGFYSFRVPYLQGFYVLGILSSRDSEFHGSGNNKKCPALKSIK